jgi:hypothetical protein
LPEVDFNTLEFGIAGVPEGFSAKLNSIFVFQAGDEQSEADHNKVTTKQIIRLKSQT